MVKIRQAKAAKTESSTDYFQMYEDKARFEKLEEENLQS
jgi:hypothetical protein